MLGFGTLAKKIFGTPNDRKIKATQTLVDQVNALEPEFEKLSDEQLIEKTAEFKQRVAGGEALDALLPRPLPTVVKARVGLWVFARLTFS